MVGASWRRSLKISPHLLYALYGALQACHRQMELSTRLSWRVPQVSAKCNYSLLILQIGEEKRLSLYLYLLSLDIFWGENHDLHLAFLGLAFTCSYPFHLRRKPGEMRAIM